MTLIIASKYDKLHKEVEMEILYKRLLDMKSEQLLSLNPRIGDLLRAESSKHRNGYMKSIITPDLKEAAK